MFIEATESNKIQPYPDRPIPLPRGIRVLELDLQSTFGALKPFAIIRGELDSIAWEFKSGAPIVNRGSRIIDIPISAWISTTDPVASVLAPIEEAFGFAHQRRTVDRSPGRPRG